MGQTLLKIGKLRDHDGSAFTATLESEASIRPGEYAVISASPKKYILCQVELVSLARESFDLGELGKMERSSRIVHGRFLLPFEWDPFDGLQGILDAQDLQTEITSELSGNLLLLPPNILNDMLEKISASLKIQLRIGELRLKDANIAVSFAGEKMNRHTCLIAQSGAGKSYALGLLIEELFVKSLSQIIIIDPHGDFGNFTSPKSRLDRNAHFDVVVNTEKNNCLQVSQEDYDTFLEKYRKLPTNLIGISHNSDYYLGSDFRFLSSDERKSLLTFNSPETEFQWNMLEASVDPEGGLSELILRCEELIHAQSKNPTQHVALRQLHDQLGKLHSMQIWGDNDHRHLYLDLLNPYTPSLNILDLSGLSSLERDITVSKLLEFVWNHHSAERQPIFIVIDEAHNFAPVGPKNVFEENCVDQLIRIAGEGRKFGIFLLLVTQRPSKIHPSVLSECSNLLVMKMTNRLDIKAIQESYAGFPDKLGNSIPLFQNGEALLLGPIVPWPMLIRFGRRRLREAGQDIALDNR